MIPPDVLFLALAGIAFLGFVIDSLFYRLRVTSVLPLMLLGVALVLSGQIPVGTIGLLNAFIPYVSALTVAFILFHVGLDIRFSELFHVLGRATAYTLAVQATTGVVLSLLAFWLIHWSLLVSFIFGFALSGPSSIAVPVLVRLARMPARLKSALLYESVITDVLQLLVPILLIGFLVSGSVSTVTVASTLVWSVIGSGAAGAVAAIIWLAILDRMRRFAAGYTWTLTITMVLATYGAAQRLGLSAAITIFVFGLTLGNGRLLDFRESVEKRVPGGWLSYHLHELRSRLRISTRGLDIPHILQVQKEVSFFASSFFFVYIGLLFQVSSISLVLVAFSLLGALVMLGVRFAYSPVLSSAFDAPPSQRRVQRGLLGFNISRGLASAVVATIPQGFGIVIPGFLDGIFLAVMVSNIVSTVGVFLVYSPGRPAEPLDEGPEAPVEYVPEFLRAEPTTPVAEAPPSARAAGSPTGEVEPPGSSPPPLPTRRPRRPPPGPGGEPP